MISLLAAGALTFVHFGDAMAFGGKVVHTKNLVLAADDENAYAPTDPDTAVKIPADAQVVADDPAECRKLQIDSDIAVGAGESVAAVAHGTVGGIENATVVLVRGKRETDLMGYAMLRIEVWDGATKRGSMDVRDDAYPCALVIDDLDGKPGNEIAVAWMSLGAGYSAGVTVFQVK
ncbi:MAG TPA: hypothetical protein VMV18_15765 [bacterium]|nr:hypothetical protein [bacterium]